MKSLIAILFLLLSTSAQSFTLVINNSNMKGWNTDVLKFHLNLENCPDGIESLIDDAMAVWNSVPTSNIRIERGDYTSETYEIQAAGQGQLVPGIFCITDMAAVGEDPNSIPGRAGSYATIDNHLSSASLILNTDPNGRANISRLDPTLVKVIIAHEIGHVLGLGHSEDKAALMYYDGTLKKHLALAPDDMHGISYLYPRNELGKDPLMGCATAGGLPHAPVNLIVLLIPALLGIGLSVKNRKD